MPVPRHALRILAIGFAVGVLLLGGLGWFVRSQLDPDRLKPRLIEAVERATGRTLTIAAPIAFKLSLVPTLTLGDVSFANPPGFSRPAMLTAGKVEVTIALLPLLHRRIEVDHVLLVRPDILLETDSAGHANWRIATNAATAPVSGGSAPAGSPGGSDDAAKAGGTPPPGASDGGGGLSISVRELRIEDAAVGWRDGATGRTQTASIPKLTIAAPDPNGPMHADATIAALGKTVGLTIDTGPLARLMGGGARVPWPVSLRLESDGATLAVKGAVARPDSGQGYDLTVNGDVPDPAKVIDGLPPALKAVTLQFRLTDAPGPVPFQLASSAGDLSGTIAIVTQPKLSVSGAVTSQRLDLDVLKAGGGGAGDGAARPSGAPAAPSAGGRAGPVIPDTPLPFAALHQADADLTMTIAVLHVGGTDIKDIAATVALKDGTLRIDPLSIADPNDRLTASVVVDAATVPASVHLILHTPGIATKPLLALFGLPEAVSGAAEITADLTGTGNSPHEIAATLNGWFGLAIPSGQLDAKLIDKWLEKLRPLQIPGEMTALRCLAVRADMKAGVAAIRPVALSTPGLVLDGTGDVYLGPETLALRLRPRAAIGGTGVAVPVKIGGTLRDPKASVDIAPDSAAGGLAGLLLGGKGLLGDLGGGDPCPAALARARDVAAPAEAAPKPAAAPSVPGLPKGVAPAATDMFRRLLPGVGR